MRARIIAATALTAVLIGQVAAQAESLYKRSLPSIMTIRAKLGSGDVRIGTAFLTVGQGFAATAYHIVEDAVEVTAHFSNGEVAAVTGLVDVDVKRDLALLKVEVTSRPMLSIAQRPAEIGAKTYVIGSPQGLDFSMSDGLISQFRQIEGVKHIQYSAPTNPGNSGGPLLNAEGQVVGIVSWKLRGAESLNFAVDSIYLKDLNSSLEPKLWTKTATSRRVSEPLPPGYFALTRKYKAGETDKYKLAVTATMAIGQADINMLMNQTTKKVYENGDADIETQIAEMRVSFGGNELPMQNEQMPSMTQKFDKFGQPVGQLQAQGGGSGGAGAGMMNQMSFMKYALAPLGQALKIGEAVKIDEKDGKDESHTTGTVVVEKVEGGIAFLTINLTVKTKQTSEAPMKIAMKSQVVVETGKLTKLEGDVTNLPPNEQGMTVDSVKIVMEKSN